MAPFQFIRAVITMIATPMLTLLVSIATLIAVFCFRTTPKNTQIVPRVWARAICRLTGVKVKIEGLENISADQTYIFVANHVSQYDIFTFQGYFPHDFRWIAKKELFKIPLFGAALRRSGMIPIDRSQGRNAIKSLDKAADRIRQGASVLIFPEGTRSPDGTLREFKYGAVLLAIKSGVPVVPIGFNGTYDILPKGKKLPASGEVVIRVGQPIATDHYKPKDKQILAQNLQARVAALLSSPPS